jgi:hypothetical protein
MRLCPVRSTYDPKHSALQDGTPGIEHERLVIGCRVGGDFVAANFSPTADGVELWLVSSFDETLPCPDV